MTLNTKHGYKRSRLSDTQTRVGQLGLRIVFTAVWAQPPTVLDRCEALRERLERLSLPLGSNFLITAPAELPLVLVLQRERKKERGNNNYRRTNTQRESG